MIKTKRIISLILTLCFIFILCGCSSDNSGISESTEQKTIEQTTIEQPTTLSEEELNDLKLDNMVASMSLEEKVGQMFYIRCPDVDAVETVSKYNIGGYVLFGRDFEDKTKDEIIADINSYQSASNIPLLIGVDEEGGTVVRVSSNPNLRDTKFLSPRDTFEQGGWNAIETDASEKADLLLSLGVNVNMAPVCDMTSDPYAFMYDRSFSADLESENRFVKTVVEICNNKKLGTVLKHFPGYGNNEDTHTGIAYDEREYSEFTDTDFVPFKTAIEAGADSILVSHNIVYCMDNEYPASISEKVHNIIRNELGFDGVIMTDDLAMDAITMYTGSDTAAVFAAKSGNDIICCSGIEVEYPAIINAVKSGDISEEQINQSVKRILKWKQKLGLIN